MSHTFTISKILLALMALLATVQCSPLVRRSQQVPHDSISPHAQAVQGGPLGNVITLFQPTMHIASGCQVYSVVDDQGNWSGGLQDTGSSTGGCRDTSKGQTYARATPWGSNGAAILYAWYWPKDQPISGDVVGGHRHDWESVAVFINNYATNPTLIKAATSAHGGYKASTAPPLQGKSPKVEYYTSFPYNHALQFTQTTGRTFPIWDWAVMKPATHASLNNVNWGKANVPFKDSSFMNNLNAAWSK